jgi:hypothetical protein
MSSAIGNRSKPILVVLAGLGRSASGDPIERILDQGAECTAFLDVSAQLSVSVLQTN